ncbi:hypothetical protein [Nitrososphaera viennensis]|uniref:Uncharacterized protein n=2 Tax=Nitrososphaera viennensis TaxID=1034015 RepID=A0A060HQ73_9ARCH|nr:hypothetical protein [Nitrososphaera viennensis]AIC17270.1 exported protein of unknown function [Nitrososphaera viennensis EN76]UVS69153.1 hypothetical protein NWT39_14780 [Nitrososphaera viennensis]
MKKLLAFAGLALLLAAIPPAQSGVSNYAIYLEGKAQHEQEALACANTVCTGFGVDYFAIGQHLDLPMQHLFSGLMVGSVGAVFLGLNWRELLASE